MADDFPKPKRENLSKTPSWIMVGFVVGCLFAYTVESKFRLLRLTAPPVVAPPVAAPEPSPAHASSATATAERPSLYAIDALFQESGGSAAWQNDLTEVAFWNPAEGKYSVFVEVMRSGGLYYYRLLPKLTRPLRRGPTESHGILFTVPEAAFEPVRSEVSPRRTAAPEGFPIKRGN